MIGLLCASFALAAPPQETAPPGQLTVIGKDGQPGILVPLKKTTVNADIAGISARVRVVQTFQNPSNTPIEAVYTFPLPAESAVDHMRMNVAGRIIEGQIKKREEARRIYETAKANGQVASLLDEERPNLFTQHVANIVPGATIEVEISYVETLKFDNGAYQFSFPMVVGPRYMPASTPDVDKIATPTLPQGVRTGTNVSVNVTLDAGAPLASVDSVLHQIETRRVGEDKAVISLKRSDEIPNKDFILRYKLKGDGIREQFVTHDEGNGNGTFCLVLNPPVKVQPTQVRPREVVFVMDQSGSQAGFPLEKSKELTIALIDTLRQNDVFNVVSFSNGARKLWPESRSNTPANVQEAREYVQKLDANGGTEFLPAIEMSLSQPSSRDRLKLVVFNTDGYVGNEYEILQRIQKYRDHARMFTFGIGNSVNHFLIDTMSVEGRGGYETVTLNDKAEDAKKRFIAHTHSPILTDIDFDFKGVTVTDTTPQQFPDLFAGQPLVVFGRYKSKGAATLTVRGRVGTESWSRDIKLDFSGASSGGSGVSTLWARRKITDLSRSDWMSLAANTAKPTDSTEAITNLGLKYGLMTPFTSFVAVEQRVVNVGGKQRQVAVPLEMPDGVTFAGTDKDEKFNGGTGGAGGGGGRASFGAAAKVKPQTTVPTGLGKVLADPTTNTFIVQGTTDGMAELERLIREKKITPMDKVDRKLVKSSEKLLEVKVFVGKLDDAVLAELKKAGLKVDDKDSQLKVVFGTISKDKLESLAKVTAVIRVAPLE